MQTMAQLTKAALTGTKAPSTPPPQVNTANWAKWAEFETCDDPQLTAMVAAMARFILALKEGGQPRWLSLLGTTGNGKTHLASRAWKFAQRRFDWSRTHYVPSVIYWPDFVDELRGGGVYDHYEDMKRWPALMVDDIGAERDTTGFASEKLNTLLGCRTDKWTILTSNLGLDQIEAIDRRISSRIVRGANMWVESSAQDYAIRKHY